MELVAGRIFWVDACWPHGAVVNMNVCGASVRCRVSGKTPPAVTRGALVLGVVGGLWLFPVAVIVAGWACVSGWWWWLVLCENWIVDASILIFL